MVHQEALTIAFMHVGPDTTQARMMVDSANLFGHRMVQLTDSDSPRVEGAECVRLPREGMGLMHFRAKLYVAFNEPGIYMDTDMLVRHDLSPIMAMDFDLAVTRRNHDIIDPNGVNVGKLMPYNGGLVAVKDASFWPDVETRMSAMDEENRKWYGDQVAIAEVAKTRNVLELPARIYNRTTKKVDADIAGAWVLHFKGRGKEVMSLFA